MKTKIADALLAVQSALLGVVTPQLRGVSIDIDEENEVFHITFFYDGEVSEDILELWSCASTEASCHIPLGYQTDEKYMRLDFPQELPVQGRYAYLRKE